MSIDYQILLKSPTLLTLLAGSALDYYYFFIFLIEQFFVKKCKDVILKCNEMFSDRYGLLKNGNVA